VLISFCDFPALEAGSPNKFFDGLAAGKIIITNYKSWISDLIIEHNCGFYVPVGQDLNFYLDNISIEEMRKNALTLAQKFDKTIVTEQIIDFALA
jgi:hypothetical protein